MNFYILYIAFIVYIVIYLLSMVLWAYILVFANYTIRAKRLLFTCATIGFDAQKSELNSMAHSRGEGKPWTAQSSMHGLQPGER